MNAQNNEVNELLRKGIEAARERNFAAAREYLQQVVELDERNEKGWFWLASVVETDEERRVCLSNVLHINPNNEKARKTMDALEAKARQKVNAEEVVPGITRRQLTLVLGIGGSIILVIILIFAVSSINRNNEVAAQNSLSTQIAVEATQFIETATQQSVMSTETQRALATDTPTPTETSSRATLPPTWTPTPLPEQQATTAPLPPVTGLRGNIVAMSGVDTLNNGFLPIGFFNLDQNGTWSVINPSYGRDLSFTPDGQRVVYIRYDALTFGSVVEFSNLNGTEIENMTDADTGVLMLEPEHTRFSADGQSITFVARTNSLARQLFVYNRFERQVRQLTDTNSDFSYPSFSPDSRRIAVIRNDINSSTPGADIVSVDVASGGQVPVSTDKASFIEQMPQFTPDGSQIIYSVASSTAPNDFDIFIRAANGSGSPLPLIRENGSAETHPVISPDGQHIAFASNRTGAWDIYVYNVQTQAITQLTSSPEEDYPFDWWMPN